MNARQVKTELQKMGYYVTSSKHGTGTAKPWIIIKVVNTSSLHWTVMYKQLMEAVEGMVGHKCINIDVR